MSFQNNPNIIKVTGTVREINGRSFLGRNGVDDIDDVWHFASIVIEDANGGLLKFERVTTNEKIDAEIEIGNTATFYFRRIQGWKKSVFHIVATESEVRGNNYFSLVRTIDVLKQRLVAIGILPIAYLLGWIFVGLPVSYIFGTKLASWLVLIVPGFLFYFLAIHHSNPASVRKDSLAVRKELERSRVGQKFAGRELKTV
ncbi:hypothetical protein LXM94_02575 [Rhizobium sp. TRM95111]|uniref:hypothetical protein n=1 Tax=Rhizobium alarense TaxID=2846851 RepID=UPI001F16F656|nr:hypothetical protein [Rhizobium alarense]MCF3638853.1 hypothetical protein [Rhizobium alarense]